MCRIMSKDHTYRGVLYIGIKASIECDITKSTTRINMEGGGAALENIWVAPNFNGFEINKYCL